MARSLLVPFNGRAASQAALREACATARGDGSAVIALYVVHIPRQLPLSAQLPWLAQEVTAVFDEAERIGRAEGTTVWSEWVAARDVARAIVDVAEDLETDQIVLGLSRRHHALGWLWPWSTAAQVLGHATRPVLVHAEPVGSPRLRGAASSVAT